MVYQTTATELKTKRDAKVKPHLEQYAPVWMIEEKLLLEEEAIQFNIVFLHPHAGVDDNPAWVSRRYRYDAFNDTLYHKGQTVIDEEKAVEIQLTEPYMDSALSDVRNSYGG